MLEDLINKITCADCMDILKKLPDKCIDMILCDLPYGTTACKWDTIIPFEPLWESYKRIIKDDGAIVLTASQPFTSALVMSNPNMFKYEWIWKKAVGSNFATTKYMPMKEHESVLVFGKGKIRYYPIPQERSENGKKRCDYGHSGGKTGEANGGIDFKGFDKSTYDKEFRCPSSVQFFNNREKDRGIHPTQKPVALFEYLIKTYTQPNELVLDNCSGSGTTAIACLHTGRRFICIEKDKDYWEASVKRLEDEQKQGVSFWNEQDVLRYIVENNLEISSVYGNIEQTSDGRYYTTGRDRTGCMFCMYGVHLEKNPNRFDRMKETHPIQYEYIMNKLNGKHILNEYLKCANVQPSFLKEVK